MFNVVWTLDARTDVHRAYLHIQAENPDAAMRVAQALLDLGETLKLFPRRGRKRQEPGGREVRELSHPRLPYVVQYLITGQNVVIEHIWHTAQNRP